MNVFYTNSDPIVCADEHCVTHTNKMITEYAQLLSTAHRVLDGVPHRNAKNRLEYRLSGECDTNMYKATHVNHPSAQWVRESSGNYEWLLTVLMQLCENYKRYKGKQQKVEWCALPWLMDLPKNINVNSVTEPPVCAPDRIVDVYNKCKSVTWAYKHFIVDKIMLWEKYPEMGKRAVNTDFYIEPVWYREIRKTVEG